jgi:predicted dehydrogenase
VRPRLAVIGAGLWGVSYVRALAQLPTAELTWICDVDPTARDAAHRIAPTARTTGSYAEVLAAPNVDAIVIATPARSHAELALAAIERGRHVLIEKPVTLAVADADALVHASERRGVVAMVGHLMVYHPAVQRLARLVHAGELGEIYYLSSTRSNLGRARSDENALWSFGPHDLSMIDLLLQQEPASVTARGESYLRAGIEDVVFLNLAFPRAAAPLMANVHLSWLSPRKERRLVVVGSKKMAEFDDCAEHPLRIYDRGYDRPSNFADFAEYLTLRNGEVSIVPVEMTEPLVAEVTDFLACIVEARKPKATLQSGARIVRWLAAAQASMDAGGLPVAIPVTRESVTRMRAKG